MDIAFIGIYITTLLYIVIRKKDLLKYLLLSSTIGLTWVLLGKNMYSYNHDYLSIVGLSTYPLFGWPLGLFGMYLLFLKLKEIFKTTGFAKDFLLFTITYAILLIVAEMVFYHLFNVHDIATAENMGIQFCDCMHAPNWMKAVYFGMGPIYFVVIKNLLETKKPA